MNIEEFNKLNPIAKKAVLLQTQIAKDFVISTIAFLSQMYALFKFLNGGHWVYIAVAAFFVCMISLNIFSILLNVVALISLHTSKNSLDLSMSALEALSKVKEDSMKDTDDR